MDYIKINELARELEVKAQKILDWLPELGVHEKKTHSSSITEDVAREVRRFVGHEPEKEHEMTPLTAQELDELETYWTTRLGDIATGGPFTLKSLKRLMESARGARAAVLAEREGCAKITRQLRDGWLSRGDTDKAAAVDEVLDRIMERDPL